MSKLNNVIENDNLTSDAKILYAYIFINTNALNEFKISLVQLTNNLNITRPTISKATQLLEKLNLISVQRRPSKAFGHLPNIYSIVI